MYKKIFQKVKRILSVTVSIVFWTWIVLYMLMLLWEILDLQSFFGTNLEEIMTFKLKMSVMFLAVCLMSVWSNKKVLMLVLIVAWWHLEGFYTTFSEYNKYLEKENCIDFGYVWDYDEHRCRQDCRKWDKELGCLKE